MGKQYRQFGATLLPEAAGGEAGRAGNHNGWSAERKSRFLALLAGNGNVRVSAARVGLSAQSVYKLRRRDPLFARGWAAAIVLARDESEQVLADRALAGVAEPIFYRGEQVGTRRRYDTRLLLAHLARLDRLADETAAGEDAERFDELLAMIACERPDEALFEAADSDDGPLPATRERFVERAGVRAEAELRWGAAADEYDDDDDDDDDDDEEDRPDEPAEEEAEDDGWDEDTAFAAGREARRAAEVQWDGWYARACAIVDRLEEGGLPTGRIAAACLPGQPSFRLRTLSTVSTAGLAVALAGDSPGSFPLPTGPRRADPRRQVAKPPACRSAPSNRRRRP